MLVDSGSTVSIIKCKNIFKEDLNNSGTVMFKGMGSAQVGSLGWCALRINLLNNRKLKCNHNYSSTIKGSSGWRTMESKKLMNNQIYNGKTIKHRIKFHVISDDLLDEYDGILGNDFLRKNNFTINYQYDSLENETEEIDLLYKNKEDIIKPRTEVLRLMKINHNNNTKDENEFVVEKGNYHGILVPDCIVKINKEDHAWINMCNVEETENKIDFEIKGIPLKEFQIMKYEDSKEIQKPKIKTNKRIKKAHKNKVDRNRTSKSISNKLESYMNTVSLGDNQYKENNTINTLSNKIDKNKFKKILDNIRIDHLNREEKHSLLEILKNYEHIFSLDGENLSATTVTEHKIRTINSEPIHTKTYRYPKIHEEEVREQVEKLKNEGVIRDSQSPWNSPLWIVPKKTDASGKTKWRMVIDYRKLNELTIPDNYPIPNIHEILDQLGKSKYFTTLDLKSGFHQIPIAEEDIEKTAFSTPYGHFEFTRMPFGLRNAPACFQRMMNTVLSGLQGIKCFVYLDDIVIYGQDLDEHNMKLIQILEQLNRVNLKIQLDKSEFLRKEVNYLGHVITENGVLPDENKIEAIKRFKPPTCVKEIKSFLGMIGYYRKFIENFSITANPINKLLKKNSIFEWGVEQQNSFEKLKAQLIDFTILQYPDYEKMFIITTDASNLGIGAVLSQNINGKDLPIQFISRTLNGAEKNYSTTEKECLGIVWAVKQFRPYIYGRKFIIRTDHRPLQWLFNVKDPGSRLVRWRLKLEEYDYQIEYKQGKDNKVADELSRNVFITLEEEQALERNINEIFGEEIDNTPTGQCDIENENSSIDKTPNEGVEQIYDENLKLKILEENHNSILGGHTGQKGTINRIREKYSWLGLNRDVIEYIKKCKICQTEKIERHPHKNPMTVVSSANHCLEKIAIDIVGPYKPTKNKNQFGLTIQDDLSKFIKFIPIPNKDMETVARNLVEGWMLNYGLPKTILSDNGSEFCNSLMTEIAKLFGFDHITTSVAYPQSNGSLERAHARLNEYLRLIDKNPHNDKNWDENMKYASYCYNTTVHTATGYTPYELVFGRKSHNPSEIDYDTTDTINDYAEDLKYKLIKMEIKAKEKLQLGKEKSKNRYDKCLGNQYEFKKGDLILVRNERKGKLDSFYRGPYKIISLNENNVMIIKNNKRVKYNKSHIKPFIDVTPSENLQ